ncbi:TetR/AcrR family transcriptional regulator [Microbacterium aurugineum]|uniref:TetR/AcrR family transcriptional regulator n=1 Tax=Microbacterium TaxID=33882 RepID=UPI00103C7676|nr:MULTISPECIES: TetR/AcrR family transcriptional regulator [Microbacterium]MCK8467230.1 TetR/AcrR family transcriptional regulator [Microbacterium aurugineum]MCZ4300162.1 TetR/AcrR family transcriptional regulator [Microbacterium oxydans]TCJ21628.1 TetR/AcrR family transcriptional regulator [Microbacterium sp. PI-1]
MAEQRRRRVNVVAGDRRRELREAASGIVREEGFGAATVKAITARAGMSAGLLYTYVDSVDDLLADVFRQCAGAELTAVDDAVHAAPDDARARLVALIETFAARALRGRRLAWALLAEPVGRAVDEERLAYRRGYAALLDEIVRQGIASEVFAPQDPAITAAGLVGAIGEALTGPLSPVSGVEDAPDPESVVATITALCLRAVGER